MSIELSYMIITPYTVLKSRTGGVIARLLARTDIELVATQIFAPTQELADWYADTLKKTVGQRNEPASQMFYDYIKRTFSPTGDRRHRVMMLVFKGEDACKKLFAIAGDIYSDTQSSSERITGETIRDTYADLVIGATTGKVRYFEPAVLTPPTMKSAMMCLKVFAKFAANESNIVENIKYEDPTAIERTLVIIKPDNWRYPSAKPGNIIDMFSRTGLRIIGCKIYQMSVAEAMEFYGPVKDVLREKLAPSIGDKAAKILEDAFAIQVSDENMQKLSETIGITYADSQFSSIIKFMSGTKPEKCPIEDKEKAGKVKCMVLVYEGKDAVEKIRDVLGPTDPTKAPSGTIRKEFGQDVMVNTAHASDSPENAKREMNIVKIQQNKLAEVIETYIKEYN